MSLLRYICPLCYKDGFTKTSLKAHGCRGVFGNRWTRKLTRHEVDVAKTYRVPDLRSLRPLRLRPTAKKTPMAGGAS